MSFRDHMKMPGSQNMFHLPWRVFMKAIFDYINKNYSYAEYGWDHYGLNRIRDTLYS